MILIQQESPFTMNGLSFIQQKQRIDKGISLLIAIAVNYPPSTEMKVFTFRFQPLSTIH